MIHDYNQVLLPKVTGVQISKTFEKVLEIVDFLTQLSCSWFTALKDV